MVKSVKINKNNLAEVEIVMNRLDYDIARGLCYQK